jgi:hypothetical protein
MAFTQNFTYKPLNIRLKLVSNRKLDSIEVRRKAMAFLVCNKQRLKRNSSFVILIRGE